MPNLLEVQAEIFAEAATGRVMFDEVRAKYISLLHQKTKRNVIAYYSGWLQKPGIEQSAINDKDKSAFMLAVNKMNHDLGLDLILHTPGGDVAATESIMDYLHSIFDGNIRAIVPQLAMSGGTMIALSCKEVIMGKQSSLGPVDPQFNGLACQAILDEFEEAKADIKTNPSSAQLWHAIVSKYHPTLLISCRQAVDWSRQIAKVALQRNMCKGRKDDIGKILDVFANHSVQKAHNRHIPMHECRDAGLSVLALEDDQELQEFVLSAHHAFMLTLQLTPIYKLVENQLQCRYIEHLNLPAPPPQAPPPPQVPAPAPPKAAS